LRFKGADKAAAFRFMDALKLISGDHARDISALSFASGIFISSSAVSGRKAEIGLGKVGSSLCGH